MASCPHIVHPGANQDFSRKYCALGYRKKCVPGMFTNANCQRETEDE